MMHCLRLQTTKLRVFSLDMASVMTQLSAANIGKDHLIPHTHNLYHICCSVSCTDLHYMTLCLYFYNHSDVVDHWENSTLVAYVPPFSGKVVQCVLVVCVHAVEVLSGLQVQV